MEKICMPAIFVICMHNHAWVLEAKSGTHLRPRFPASTRSIEAIWISRRECQVSVNSNSSKILWCTLQEWRHQWRSILLDSLIPQLGNQPYIHTDIIRIWMYCLCKFQAVRPWCKHLRNDNSLVAIPSCAVDVMQSLLQTSRDVLEKIYIACKGLSAKHQQTSHMFLSTYHEVHFS